MSDESATMTTVIEQNVLTCVAAALNVEQSDLSMQTKIGEHPAWDSMGHITIYFELQKQFSIELPIEEAAEVRSVEDWVNLMRRHAL